jgi:hypothetical protein
LSPNEERQAQMNSITTSPIQQEGDYPHFPMSDIQPPFSSAFPFSPAASQSTFDQPIYPYTTDTDAPSGAGSSKPNTNVQSIDPGLQSAMTPSGVSQAGSSHTNEDKDPFLTLLEQLAENEHSRGGPSDLDFYLGDQANP